MTDYLFRGSLAELDPDVFELTQIEAERQYRKLILIPSESSAPMAVREALSSAFQNIYAEGYPDEDTRWMSEDEILDYTARLGHFRRYSDPRYYKGVEYANVVEALARRRCAETFAANGISADEIYVNVQALSGGPANNAVYHALVKPGETIMGMDLLHGGHLSHGSPVNRSGKYYNAVHYTVDPQTEKLDYDQIEALARQHKPRFIIGGFSSYPWTADWARLRAIADAVGAYLFADIAHVAGLVAAGVYPSPIGYADVITFTTHKSLNGPRGACILTTSAELARKIDRAVFPGEQGGPHVNVFAAQAIAFKLAQSEQFRQLQTQVVNNCVTFTDQLRNRGLRIPFGGTNTHLTNLDCSTLIGPDGSSLSGDQAARILDIAGVVVNRNTIPGDKSAVAPSGIRMGTPWVTQRGFKETEMVVLANLIADLLQATTPFSLEGRKGGLRRAKVDFGVLEEIRMKVRDLALSAGIDFEPSLHGYPHFYYRDDKPKDVDGWVACDLRGSQLRQFLDYALSADLGSLQPGESLPTCLHTPQGTVEGAVTCLSPDAYRLSMPVWSAGLASIWLRDLSDGYVAFDSDPLRKLPGPVIVRSTSAQPVQKDCKDVPLLDQRRGSEKPYFIGMPDGNGEALPDYVWQDREAELRRTPLYEIHKQLGAKIIPFAGWEMPVWYSSVMEEHQATRLAAGLFDVAHMGVYQAEGPVASAFLDSVCANDIGGLDVGESCYTHFLDPQAQVIDDTLVYRRGKDKFLIVVNASNDDKDWGWLNAVRSGTVKIDNERPWAKAFGREVVLRNLRDPREGQDMRVDIALQGPRSRDVLLALGCDSEDRQRILGLKRTQLCDAVVGGYELIVSRTGYTGEKMAFELFVHPERATGLFQDLLKAGESYGVKPVGLGARDSLRTEAGLPLYGHEMGIGSGQRGESNLGVAEAGFGSYVKTYKPWFIGRNAYLKADKERKGVVVRFRFSEKAVRMAHNGDPVLDKRGRVIGWVTSCAVDSEGFLTGQAFVEGKSAVEGTVLLIFQSAPEKTGKAPAALSLSDRATVPTPAVVISRFPK
ncbi:MAG: serine hydroxymethyltransferase [Anaerolineales bacterium]|nr:MAG: serine hydroxymethyltransferase [Anaerolineales bacterium]